MKSTIRDTALIVLACSLPSVVGLVILAVLAL